MVLSLKASLLPLNLYAYICFFVWQKKKHVSLSYVKPSKESYKHINRVDKHKAKTETSMVGSNIYETKHDAWSSLHTTLINL